MQSRRLVLTLLLAAAASAAAWTDWDRRQSCHPTEGVVQPASVEEVVARVRAAHAAGDQLKTVGSGHSFSPITLTDDAAPAAAAAARRSVLLNLDKLDRVLALPATTAATPTVHVEAGIRVHDLNAQLLAAGWALANTGAIAIQSIAGATQTGTHGTGTQLGSMSSQLEEITLVLANASVVTCSASVRPDLFGAARVGLGALGILVRVKVRVVPKFKLRRIAMPYDLDRLMRDLPRLNAEYERLQWYYTPFTDNATLLLRVPVPLDTPIEPCWPGDWEQALAGGGGGGNNVTCVDWSFKALCHEADDAILYTEMEYFVERQHAAALAADFRAFQDSLRNQSRCAGTVPKTGACSLFTGVRYGARDDVSWMSQMTGRDIAVVSNIVLGTTEVAGPQDEFALFGRGLERIAGKYGGRPHWGKMNWATAADLRPQYPMFDRFVALRRELDPGGMFLNDYLRRVLGVGGGEVNRQAEPATSAGSRPYGNPYLSGGCPRGELNMSVTGVPGLYCAPKCSVVFQNDCNPAKAPGVSAMPECMIAVNSSENNYCALICNVDAPQDQCDTAGGAQCHHVSGNQGVCTYESDDDDDDR